MPKFPATEAPEDLVNFARAQIAAGRFTDMEQLVRAGVESLKEQAEESATAEQTAWAGYLARKPSDPRDVTAGEAAAFLHSDDPEKRHVIQAHFDALCRDMDEGKGIETTPEALFAGIRSRLGVQPA